MTQCKELKDAIHKSAEDYCNLEVQRRDTKRDQRQEEENTEEGEI